MHEAPVSKSVRGVVVEVEHPVSSFALRRLPRDQVRVTLDDLFGQHAEAQRTQPYQNYIHVSRPRCLRRKCARFGRA